MKSVKNIFFILMAIIAIAFFSCQQPAPDDGDGGSRKKHTDDEPEHIPAYKLVLDSFFGIDANMNMPMGIAVDSSGNVYVTDYAAGGNVYKFVSSLFYEKTYTGFLFPSDLAVNSNGNLVILDQVHQLLKIVNIADGTVISSFPIDAGCFGLGLDGAGNIYIANNDAGQVKKYDAQGNLLLTIDNAIGAIDVAISPDGLIYVLSYDNGKIYKFSPGGIILQEIGSEGSGDNEFYYPWSIAIDKDGKIYVSDCGNKRVKKMEPSGNLICQLQKDPLGNDYFGNVYGIAVTEDGTIYLVDGTHKKIAKIHQEQE